MKHVHTAGQARAVSGPIVPNICHIDISVVARNGKDIGIVDQVAVKSVRPDSRIGEHNSIFVRRFDFLIDRLEKILGQTFCQENGPSFRKILLQRNRQLDAALHGLCQIQGKIRSLLICRDLLHKDLFGTRAVHHLDVDRLALLFSLLQHDGKRQLVVSRYHFRHSYFKTMQHLSDAPYTQFGCTDRLSVLGDHSHPYIGGTEHIEVDRERHNPGVVLIGPHRDLLVCCFLPLAPVPILNAYSFGGRHASKIVVCEQFYLVDILFGFKLHLDKRCLLSVIIGPAVPRPFVNRRPLFTRNDPIC